MTLCRLIYASKVPSSFDSADMTAIIEVSRANNEKNHITGALAFDRKYFLQCLEGGRLQLNELYARIAADSRHESCLLLSYQDIQERAFPSWMMNYTGATRKNQGIFFRYSENDQFLPMNMSGESAYRLLQALESEGQR